MPRVARVGDPISHGGAIITGSPDHKDEGKPVARVGDSASCVKHGVVVIVAGSGPTTVNGRKLARVGDPLSCGAVISAGSGAHTDT